jgi:hypothetical protein
MATSLDLIETKNIFRKCPYSSFNTKSKNYSKISSSSSTSASILPRKKVGKSLQSFTLIPINKNHVNVDKRNIFKRPKINNLNTNIEEVKRLYINWDLDPRNNWNFQEWELKSGLHDWALWRVKINENLISTSLFKTPFILNENKKYFIKQDLSDSKENIVNLKSRSNPLSNTDNFIYTTYFQIQPRLARFVYYYGFTRQNPIIDPESFMFYGIPRVNELYNLINNKDIGYADFSDNASEKITKEENTKQKHLSDETINILLEKLKYSNKECTNNNNLADEELKNKHIENKRLSFKNEDSIFKETIHLYNNSKKSSENNSPSIKKKSLKNRVSSKNSLRTQNSSIGVNSNQSNLFSNFRCSKLKIKTPKPLSEANHIITGINVKEKVRAFESVVENNINKTTPKKKVDVINTSIKKECNEIIVFQKSSEINNGFEIRKSENSQKHVDEEINLEINYKLSEESPTIQQNENFNISLFPKNDNFGEINFRNHTKAFISHQMMVIIF